MNSRAKAQRFLSRSGLLLDGPHPWDPHIHDEHVFNRIFSGGTFALGESYMDGQWDVGDLADFTHRMFRSDFSIAFLGIGIIGQILRAKLFNLQNEDRAFKVAEKHYDIGNKLYTSMLGERMVYSCGYWKNASNLKEAQEHKMDLVCKKIGLQKGHTLLDVGSGWGGFAKFAAEKYGARVVGLTVSKEQAEYSRMATKGLPVEIRLQDWREISNETFDRVVSIGMFEHVGPRNYRDYFKKMYDVLTNDGLFLLHTIGHSKTTRNLEPWFNKYIFPNGHVPSMAQICNAFDRRWFERPLFLMEDWHNFGTDYDKTLTSWFENFDAAWPELKKSYDERFYRMWKYYLLVSAGMFRARYLQVWQIVFSKKGVEGGYVSIR